MAIGLVVSYLPRGSETETGPDKLERSRANTDKKLTTTSGHNSAGGPVATMLTGCS